MSKSAVTEHTGSRMAVFLAVLMFLVVAVPPQTSQPLTQTIVHSSSENERWDGYSQPWAQYARTPTHNQTIPAHGPDGGPGEGNVSDVVKLGTLEAPVVNWQAFNSGDGSDAYGSVIGDFSASINAAEAAIQRCGEGTLFPVMISSEVSDGSRESFLNIVSGNDAKLAWRVSLGITESIRSTPMIHDIDSDGFQEIIVVYDTQGALNIDVWAPRLTCTESNWQSSGHSNELLWSYSDTNVRIGSPSPHFPTDNTGHKAVTQPLLADLELDGSPELIVAVVDDPENNPAVYVNAYSLTTSVPSEEDWSVNLDRGTHPSDPVWAQLDGSTSSVLLTTIDTNSGNMWIWQIDGSTGSLDWERVAVQGTDSGNSDAPRLRLPGPVIGQLDQDAAPEMILTVPTDPNGRTSGTGARYIGMEITSTTELFNFRAPNGYADAQPTLIDTDEDGVDDRLCWVTWYSESSINFNRKGMLGCTDISDFTPVNEWVRDLQRGSGVDNDEIAASPPFWMDIDGEGTPEVLVGFGRRMWAFDGDTGASADINNAWSTPLSMPHRVWTAPAIADVDGDGHIDVLFGDTLVSNRGVDLTPALDNRGLSFNPAQADPGQTVLVTGQFSNMGTSEAEDDIDASIIMNGVELKRERFTSSEPVAPTGEGGPQTFTAEFVAELGVHEFELRLDVNGNITELREDNNQAQTLYTVVEPYVAEMDGPLETPRIPPGTTQSVDIRLVATGSRTADWNLDYDASGLPESWEFTPSNGEVLTRELTPNVVQTVTFDAQVPATALGDETGVVSMVLSLASDPSVNTTLDVQLEVFRTRGLDLTGATGLNESYGHGRPGNVAKAWFMIENLGNAQETTTSISWTAPSWGGTPSIHDDDGNTLFSITLAPGETKELFAHLGVPSTSSYGSTTQSTLTVCMGSGDDSLCESMPFDFHAKKFVATPTHHRSLPDASLHWELEGEMPTSGMVQWSMASMEMLQPNWQWTTTGDFTINGSYLEAKGPSGTALSGSLALVLPQDAVPKRHAFVDVDQHDLDAELNITLHVLQVYRAGISLLDPTPTQENPVISLNVTEPHRFLVFLTNPGNGEDTFTLMASAQGNDPSFIPDITVTYFDPTKTLGALATAIGTVDITLSEDTPALVPFTLTFTWTSQGNQAVQDSVQAEIQAAPSHEWGVSIVNQSSVSGDPGESVEIILNATNYGNAADGLTLVPEMTVLPAGNDASTWQADAVYHTGVGVNESVQFVFRVVVPPQAWAGTVVNISLLHTTNTYTIGHTNLTLTVNAVSGWQLNLTGTDLEIDPGGENVTLELVHTGNDYETPYFAKAGAGWNITLPEYAAPVAPYATSSFNVYVEPPSDAIAGEVGVLRLRITGNDTSGLIVEEIPVRVGANPQLQVDHRGVWSVNELGGFPTAWIENLGNDIAFITVDIGDLPEGWTTQQGVQLVLAPGEVAGVPIELLPAEDWNFQRFLITLNVNHPILGTITHNIEVEHAPVSFATTPVIDAFVGTSQTINYHNTLVDVPSFSSNVPLNISAEGITFVHPSTTGEQTVSVQIDGQTANLSMYTVARPYPDASVECSFLPVAFAELGRVPLSGTIGTCDFDAAENEDLRGVITVTTSDGRRVPLDEDMWIIGAGNQISVNLTVSNWEPEPGLLTLKLSAFDQYGRRLTSANTEVVSRESGWNIGVNSISFEDGDITVGINRMGFDVLADAVCELSIEAAGGWSAEYIVDIAYSDFAPVIFIGDPGEIQKDERITATIRCNEPFDMDDDPTDDTKQSYYKSASVLAVSSSDVGWVIGIGFTIFAVAWFAGLVRPPQRNPPQRASKPSPKDRQESEEFGLTDEPDVDDMNLEVESEEDSAEAPQEVFDETSMTDLIEVIEQSPSEQLPATASGRLASLRSELGDDSPQEREGTLEDRMKRFFHEE